MIVASLDPVTGELSNLRRTPALGAGEVELLAMPTDFGPWSYDAVNKLAVPSAALAKTAEQETAILQFLSSTPLGRGLRALLILLFRENNLLRARDRDRAADVAAATSLADLKTRWAARAALNDRTVALAKQALQDEINSDESD